MLLKGCHEFEVLLRSILSPFVFSIDSILLCLLLPVVYEISKILNTGLDRETLSILIGLCECGVNPEALALVVKELRRDSQNALRTYRIPDGCAET